MKPRDNFAITIEQALRAEGRRCAHAFHVRELYRVIRMIKAAADEGDLETVRALAEMTEEQPPAEPSDLNPEEFAQAFEAHA